MPNGWMASREEQGRGIFRDGGVAIPNGKHPTSPSTSSSGSGTLHEDSSPLDVRAGIGSAGTESATTSPADDISVITSSRFFKTASSSSNNKTSPSDSIFRSSDSDHSSPLVPREPFRNYKPRYATTPFHGGGGGYRSSRTWVSPDAQHMQEFLVIRNAMRRLFKHSEVAKWKYQDYIAHREAILDSQKARLAKSVKQKEVERDLKAPHIDTKAMSTLIKFLPGDQNLGMQGNTGRVLGERTIWCLDWKNGKEEISPWPTGPEMKWEGDDRAKTGVGRFLPLPREPGADTIPWNQLQVVEQYPIDQVARVPTMEDIFLPVDEIEENEKWRLINTDLEEAIDEYLQS